GTPRPRWRAAGRTAGSRPPGRTFPRIPGWPVSPSASPSPASSAVQPRGDRTDREPEGPREALHAMNGFDRVTIGPGRAGGDGTRHYGGSDDRAERNAGGRPPG